VPAHPIPKAILALRDKPDASESYEMQLYTKAHEGHERRYLYRAEYYNSVLFFG
jgi:hypothetical protein